MNEYKNRESVKDGPHIPATHQIKAAATRTWSVGEFDRWLAAHDAQVKAAAWDEGRAHGREETVRRMTDGWLEADRWNASHPNPYRRTE